MLFNSKRKCIRKNKTLYCTFSLFLVLNIVFLLIYLISSNNQTFPILNINQYISTTKFSIINKRKDVIKNLLDSFKPKKFLFLADKISLPTYTNKSTDSFLDCKKYLGNPYKFVDNSDSWKKINDGDVNETYIYSAYYDSRNIPAQVKVFGITSRQSKPGGLPYKYCYLWYNGSLQPDIVQANFKFIYENHEKL